MELVLVPLATRRLGRGAVGCGLRTATVELEPSTREVDRFRLSTIAMPSRPVARLSDYELPRYTALPRVRSRLGLRVRSSNRSRAYPR
eukprot:scaffold5340_cov131-Isochrysis_galbana.AAC.11